MCARDGKWTKQQTPPMMYIVNNIFKWQAAYASCLAFVMAIISLDACDHLVRQHAFFLQPRTPTNLPQPFAFVVGGLLSRIGKVDPYYVIK